MKKSKTTIAVDHIVHSLVGEQNRINIVFQDEELKYEESIASMQDSKWGDAIENRLRHLQSAFDLINRAIRELAQAR